MSRTNDDDDDDEGTKEGTKDGDDERTKGERTKGEGSPFSQFVASCISSTMHA